MEQRIKLTSATHFNLEKEEQIQMYTAMALTQYKFYRDPNYNRWQIIHRLKNDFSRFNVELNRIKREDPNNLVLNQIQEFFRLHYTALKAMEVGDK